VPHLRDSLIVAKVGIRAKREPDSFRGIGGVYHSECESIFSAIAMNTAFAIIAATKDSLYLLRFAAGFLSAYSNRPVLSMNGSPSCERAGRDSGFLLDEFDSVFFIVWPWCW
jgi:hypothetical protein